MFSGSTRAENFRCLEKSIEMLKEIEKHRQYIVNDYNEKKRIRFLTDHCKPIKWNGYKGKPIEMITMKIQKAREYKNILDNLMKKDTSVEERMELLILLKNYLKRHHCDAAKNYIRLLDQQMILLSTGIQKSWLYNLQDRITGMKRSYYHLLS